MPRVVLVTVSDSVSNSSAVRSALIGLGMRACISCHAQRPSGVISELRAVSRGSAELDKHLGYHSAGITVFVAIGGEERIGDIPILEGERVACTLPKLHDRRWRVGGQGASMMRANTVAPALSSLPEPAAKAATNPVSHSSHMVSSSVSGHGSSAGPATA